MTGNASRFLVNVKIMDFKIKIGFTIGFVLINLICTTSDSLTHRSENEKFEDAARLEVKKLDYAIDTIPSHDKRSCVRNNLIDAYFEKLRACYNLDICKEQKYEQMGQIVTLKDEIITLKDEIGTLNREIGTLKDEIGTLKTNLTERGAQLDKLNETVATCTTSLQKLSVRRYMEYIEKNSFPPWLLHNDMDRYERWLFAAYFLKGENMDQIRKLWSASCNTNEECTYEALAGAMHSLYETISDAEAHGEHELAQKPKQPELHRACELVAGDDAAKQLACKTAWTIKIMYSINAAGDAPTKTRCIFYGKILCSNLNKAVEQLGQLFSAENKKSDGDDVKSCEVQYEVVDILRHPSKKKSSSSKKNYVGFRANCSKAVTPEKFKSYVMGGEKGIVNSNAIKHQQDNQQAIMHIYEDPRNAPTQLTTTTASTEKPVIPPVS